MRLVYVVVERGYDHERYESAWLDPELAECTRAALQREAGDPEPDDGSRGAYAYVVEPINLMDHICRRRPPPERGGTS